jgi:flavin-dependent dehydrogenase
LVLRVSQSTHGVVAHASSAAHNSTQAHPYVFSTLGDKQTVDVLVVGGGPAGSSCAIALAREGANVMLVDAQARGRDKCCGHCLSGRAWKIVSELGLRELVESVSTGATAQVAWRSGAQGFEMNLPAFGAITPRVELDKKLLDEAERVGVRVVQPATAKWLDAQKFAVRLAEHTCVVDAKLVIAADGLGSGIARARGWNPTSPGRKYGFAGSWRAPNALANWSGERIEMRVVRGGYLGMVAESHEQIHVAGLIDRNSKLGRPDELLNEVARSWPLLAAALQEGRPSRWNAAGPLPWKPTRIADESTALVGDAAGYAEPFSGEGMRWAFESAYGLTRAWRQHGGWSAEAAQTYSKWHSDHIASRQQKTLRMAWFLEQPTRAYVICKAARTFPRVASWLACNMTR